MLTLLLSLALGQSGRPPLVYPPLRRTVCTFPTSIMTTPAEAMLPGTERRIGELHQIDGSLQLVASLGDDGDEPVFRAALRDARMELVLDLALTGASPLELSREVSVGPLTMVEDALLDVVGFEGTQVRIAPVDWGGPPSIQPTRPLEPLVRCEELRVRNHMAADFDEALRERAGVADAEERTITGGAKLYDAQGEKVARLSRRRGWHVLYVTGRHDGWVDVVINEWQGYIWRGQIKEDTLDPLDEGGVGGLGMLGGGAGEGKKPELRACPSDVFLSLSAKHNHWPMGMLLAGAPFEILERDPMDGPIVRVVDSPLYLDEGYQLRLQPGAERCPAVN